MPGILCYSRLPLPVSNRRRMRFGSFRCCSGSPDSSKKDKPTPQLLKIAVSGATEFLRIFSSAGDTDNKLVSYERDDGPPVSCIDDIVMILKSDYENAYFVTGIFTSAIYAEDCIFEDPTIKFRGKDLYSRNLKLLVPFFEEPSISLQSIEKVLSSQTECVQASWKLRTYLRLPWKPLISIEGTTVYELDNQYQIIRHVESWNVSPLEAVGQIFKPSFRRLLRWRDLNMLKIKMPLGHKPFGNLNLDNSLKLDFDYHTMW